MFLFLGIKSGLHNFTLLFKFVSIFFIELPFQWVVTIATGTLAAMAIDLSFIFLYAIKACLTQSVSPRTKITCT